MGCHEDAMVAFSRALTLDPRDAEVQHGLAKAHVASVGDALCVDEDAILGWGQAEKVWLAAIQQQTTHPELLEKKKRLTYYYPFPLLGNPAAKRKSKAKLPRSTKLLVQYTPVRDDFDALALSLGRWAFISCAPVIEHSECDAMIAAAEARAHALGGWNTDRHYSVPTTDVPVHDVAEGCVCVCVCVRVCVYV